MRRPRFGSIFLAVAVASAVAIPIFTAPAGAIVNGCTSGVNSGPGLSMFPVLPGGSSQLSIACTATTTAALANAQINYEDFPAAQWHYGAGRSAMISSTTTNTITTPACPAKGCGHFTATDVNHPVSGPGIPARAFIKSQTATVITLNISGVISPNTATTAGFTQPNVNDSVSVPVGNITALTVGETIALGATSQNYLIGKITAGTAPAGTLLLRNLGNAQNVAVGTAVATAQAVKPAANGNRLIIENSDGRSFTDGNTVATAACSATANFAANDVGRYLSGGTTAFSLAKFSKITAIGGLGTNGCLGTQTSAVLAPAPGAHAGPATLTVSPYGYPCNPLPAVNVTNCGANASQKANGVVPVSPQATYTTTNRQVQDGNYTLVAGKVCSATAKFGPTDIGLPIWNVEAPGVNDQTATTKKIPDNDFITAVSTSGTSTCATVSAALLAPTGTPDPDFVVGQPNAGAAANGDAVVNNGTELSLSPTLVAGEPACTTNTVSGFSLSGKWANPGTFGVGSGTFNTAALNQPVLGSFAFPTSVLTFNAYLLQVPVTGAATATRTDLSPHYEIIFPLVPTSAAICPAPSAVGETSVFQFVGFSPTQGAIPQGIGTPGSVSFRGLNDRSTGLAAANDTAYYHSVGTSAYNVPVTCAIVFPVTAGYPCGVG